MSQKPSLQRQFIKPAGMPCPDCKQSILIDPWHLVSAKPIACSGCGLELTIDFEASQGALNALNNYLSEFEDSEGKLVTSSLSARRETIRNRGRRTTPPRKGQK